MMLLIRPCEPLGEDRGLYFKESRYEMGNPDRD